MMKISTFYKSTIMLLHHRTLIRFYGFFNICMKEIRSLRHEEITQQSNTTNRIQKFTVGSSNIKPKGNRVAEKLALCKNVVQ